MRPSAQPPPRSYPARAKKARVRPSEPSRCPSLCLWLAETRTSNAPVRPLASAVRAEFEKLPYAALARPPNPSSALLRLMTSIEAKAMFPKRTG
ncbi:MAG: hypothetical protein IPN03_23865 [Holophagales bacterium]|nr:hypothetical protein [Holophagales bacterium]